jgi:hypothetical protein
VAFSSLPPVCFFGLLSFVPVSKLPMNINCIVHISMVGEGEVPADRQPDSTSYFSGPSFLIRGSIRFCKGYMNYYK